MISTVLWGAGGNVNLDHLCHKPSTLCLPEQRAWQGFHALRQRSGETGTSAGCTLRKVLGLRDIYNRAASGSVYGSTLFR